MITPIRHGVKTVNNRKEFCQAGEEIIVDRNIGKGRMGDNRIGNGQQDRLADYIWDKSSFNTKNTKERRCFFIL